MRAIGPSQSAWSRLLPPRCTMHTYGGTNFIRHQFVNIAELIKIKHKFSKMLLMHS